MRLLKSASGLRRDDEHAVLRVVAGPRGLTPGMNQAPASLLPWPTEPRA